MSMSRNAKIEKNIEIKRRDFLRPNKKAHKKDYEHDIDPNFTVDNILKKIGNDPRCEITGIPIDLTKSDTYSFDHIIPRSRGGLNTLENCRLVTTNQNKLKGSFLDNELFKETSMFNRYFIKKNNIDIQSIVNYYKGELEINSIFNTNNNNNNTIMNDTNKTKNERELIPVINKYLELVKENATHPTMVRELKKFGLTEECVTSINRGFRRKKSCKIDRLNVSKIKEQLKNGTSIEAICELNDTSIWTIRRKFRLSGENLSDYLPKKDNNSKHNNTKNKKEMTTPTDYQNTPTDYQNTNIQIRLAKMEENNIILNNKLDQVIVALKVAFNIDTKMDGSVNPNTYEKKSSNNTPTT